MKGLKKIALASAIAAISAGAQAELKALDDSAMGELTGQKGLTIDLETKYTIGEFAYEDAGLVVFKDLSLGANTDTTLHNINADGLLDNIRIKIDVAGSGVVTTNGLVVSQDNLLTYANSEVIDLATLHVAAFTNPDTEMAAAGSAAVGGTGTDSRSGDQIGEKKLYGDGDLVIHLGFTDAWQYGGGLAAYLGGAGSNGLGDKGVDNGSHNTTMSTLTYDGAYEILSRAVDFNHSIGKIGIADSGQAGSATPGDNGNIGSIELESHADLRGAGGIIIDTTPTTTTLISGLSINGYLGSVDISIENHGNGFSGGQLVGGGAGTGAADSKIYWDSFFNVTDLDVYIDIAGVQITDMKINNLRGDTTSLNNEEYEDLVDASGNVVLDASGNAVKSDIVIAETGDASFGFAHSKRTIYAVNQDVVNASSFLDGSGNNGFVDGVAINTEFKGDMEIGALSFGDTGTSIGSLFWTDIRSTTNWTISAH